ncbi:hypothetical protein ABTO86_19435, partial [Acinetobacter baumannii]
LVTAYRLARGLIGEYVRDVADSAVNPTLLGWLFLFRWLVAEGDIELELGNEVFGEQKRFIVLNHSCDIFEKLIIGYLNGVSLEIFTLA